MDDKEVIIESSFIKDKISFEVNMIQNINEFYIKKILENKYVNKIYSNIYVKSIKNISYSNDIYQHPNDNTFILEVQYSIVGIRYFKGMTIAFNNSHIIINDNQTFFKKTNIIAIINNVIINNNKINDNDNCIIICKVIKEPEFMYDNNILQIGLICDFIKILDNNDVNKNDYEL